MNWMNKLERKFGKYAIPNLMYYIIILYAFGFVLSIVAPSAYYQYLSLDAAAILRGQVWRILTFIIQPPNTNIWFVIFTLYLYYMIGRQLEFVWGSFRFNLYYFMGVLFHIIAALLAHFIFPIALPMGTYYLNMSLFFAYAAIYPNQQFYLMGLIPIKMKWLAWIDGIYFAVTIVAGFMSDHLSVDMIYRLYSFGIIANKAYAVMALVSLLNFLIYASTFRSVQRMAPKEVYRRKSYEHKVAQAQPPKNAPRHKCVICGRTEKDNPDLEFRYCSKCEGNYEYCQDHLFTHEHVKKS